MYIRNLKYAHLTPVFRQHNIHLLFYRQHKYIWIFCTEKPDSNANFQEYKWSSDFFSKKTIDMFLNSNLKAINSLHTTRTSSFKYVFIVCFKNQMLKYTIYRRKFNLIYRFIILTKCYGKVKLTLISSITILGFFKCN